MGFFDTLFSPFTNKNNQDAANSQSAGLTAGYAAAQPLLQQGANALTTNFMSGLNPFLTNYANAQPGATQFANAVGANGPEGYDAATKNFRAQPGYTFALQQGTENLLRNASRTGNVASGASNVDLQNLGQGMADQQYQRYVQNLQPFLGQSNTAAGGIGTMYAGLGGGLNANLGDQAKLAYQTQTGIGNAQAQADLANNQTANNIWGAIGNVGKFAASVAPFALSDRRVKEDVHQIGETYDGQPLYRFKYLGSVTPHIGLMAQDVEKRDPGAVIEIDGIKAVNYERATKYAASLAEFM